MSTTDPAKPPVIPPTSRMEAFVEGAGDVEDTGELAPPVAPSGGLGAGEEMIGLLNAELMMEPGKGDALGLDVVEPELGEEFGFVV